MSATVKVTVRPVTHRVVLDRKTAGAVAAHRPEPAQPEKRP